MKLAGSVSTSDLLRFRTCFTGPVFLALSKRSCAISGKASRENRCILFIFNFWIPFTRAEIVNYDRWVEHKIISDEFRSCIPRIFIVTILYTVGWCWWAVVNVCELIENNARSRLALAFSMPFLVDANFLNIHSTSKLYRGAIYFLNIKNSIITFSACKWLKFEWVYCSHEIRLFFVCLIFSRVRDRMF